MSHSLANSQGVLEIFLARLGYEAQNLANRLVSTRSGTCAVKYKELYGRKGQKDCVDLLDLGSHEL